MKLVVEKKLEWGLGRLTKHEFKWEWAGDEYAKSIKIIFSL